MVCAFVGGSRLGDAFKELLKAIDEVATNAVNFRSILERLNFTLRRIKPLFDDIENLNRKLDQLERETKAFIDWLEAAEKLVRRCAKFKWWNYYAKFYYEKKLLELENSLLKFLQIDVQLQTWRDIKDLLVRIIDVDAKLDKIWEIVVGFEEALILKGKEQVVVVLGPGGCGKTTLAKMLCNDKEINAPFG